MSKFDYRLLLKNHDSISGCAKKESTYYDYLEFRLHLSGACPIEWQSLTWREVYLSKKQLF